MTESNTVYFSGDEMSRRSAVGYFTAYCTFAKQFTDAGGGTSVVCNPRSDRTSEVVFTVFEKDEKDEGQAAVSEHVLTMDQCKTRYEGEVTFIPEDGEDDSELKALIDGLEERLRGT